MTDDEIDRAIRALGYHLEALEDLQCTRDCFRAGVAAGRASMCEEAAKVCEEGWKIGIGDKYQGWVFVEAIRALKD